MDALNNITSANRSKRSQAGTEKMLAAVDMGTNTFHMIVVKVDPNGRFRKVDSHKEYVRLGSGTLSTSGIIGIEAEQRALNAMRRIRQLAEFRETEMMRIVATSAVREAKNRGKFVKKVEEVAGVGVEVLSGKDEARLIYLGILQALPVYNKAVMTVDIGGGSTEFVFGYCGEVVYATSLKLGHIRLGEPILRSKDGELLVGQVEELKRQIRATFTNSDLVEKVREIGFEMAIGSSGTIDFIHQAIRKGHAVELRDGCESMPVSFQAFRDSEFTRVELNAIVKMLCRIKNKEECAKLLGFTERSIDSIASGAILLQEIFDILGIDKMTVSPYALREGVIADTLVKTCDEYRSDPNIRWSSVISFARRFNNKKRMESDMHSAQLAKELLEGLQRCKEDDQDSFNVAGLPVDENYINLMEAAIMLHSIGMFINHKGYHKHSYYLIKNNEHLHGYSPMEIEVIALLARYHRKKFPHYRHDCLSKLPQEVQKKVVALSAIIRIAVAFERSNFSAIQHVDVKNAKEKYIIVVTPSVDPLIGSSRDVSLEVWAAESESKHFEEVFQRKMSIAVAGNTATN